MLFRSVFIDQFTPIAFYKKLEEKFVDKRIFLLESAVVNEYGNYSYIFIGERERVSYKNSKSIHVDENGTHTDIDMEPLAFLQKYYANIDTSKYAKNERRVRPRFC